MICLDETTTIEAVKQIWTKVFNGFKFCYDFFSEATLSNARDLETFGDVCCKDYMKVFLRKVS